MKTRTLTRTIAAAAALLMLAAACQTEQLADPAAPFAPGQPRPLLIKPVVAASSPLQGGARRAGDVPSATRATNPSAKADGNGTTRADALPETTPVTLTGGDLTLTLSQSDAPGAPQQVSRYTLTAGTAAKDGGTAATNGGTAATNGGTPAADATTGTAATDGGTAAAPAPATLAPAPGQPTLFVLNAGLYPLAATSNPSTKADGNATKADGNAAKADGNATKADGNAAGADGSAASPLTATTTQSFTLVPHPGLNLGTDLRTATTVGPLPFGLHAQRPAGADPVTVAADGSTSLPLTISSAGLMLRMKYRARAAVQNPGETFIRIAAVRNLITGEKAPNIGDVAPDDTPNTPSRVVNTYIPDAEGNRLSVATDTEGNDTDYVLFGTLAADTRIDAGTPIAEITATVFTLIGGTDFTYETKVFTLQLPALATPAAGQLLSYTVYVDPTMASIKGDVTISDFTPAFDDPALGDIVTGSGAAADGTKPLDLDKFNAQHPVWVIYGGGDAKTDAEVAANVKAALAARAPLPNGKPDALPDGSISLTLVDVKTLGKEAFKECYALGAVHLPAATTIETLAFNYCTILTTIDLPAAKTIGIGAFSDCGRLTTISLPAAQSIGNNAFGYCTDLATISLPAAQSIGNSAFQACTALTTALLPAATTIAADAFAHSKATLVTLDLSGLTAIGDGAFKGYEKLQSITLNGAKSIGKQAFKGCYALGAVHLPAATTIGISAFNSCTGLTTIDMPAATSIEEQAFNGCGRLATVSLPAATSIGAYAFLRCDALTTISLPAAQSIGNNAFQDCTALTRISLPAATTIGSNAFNSCIALTTVSLPAAQSIGNAAFQACTALTTASLPAATSFGVNVFVGCPALTTLSLTAPGSFTFIGDSFGGSFTTSACALTLNPDKAAEGTGAGSPLVTGSISWAGYTWKSIVYATATPKAARR